MTGDAQRAEPKLADLYREVILANAAAPCGHGVQLAATHEAEGTNPLCGDRVLLQLQVEGDRVIAASFHGESCAICSASASLLCRHLPSLTVAAACRDATGFGAALSDDDTARCPAYLRAMLGVRQFPARSACALLPWRTVLDALGEGR